MNKLLKVTNIVAFASKNSEKIDVEDFDFSVSELMELATKSQMIFDSLRENFHLPLSGDQENVIMDAVRVFDELFDKSYKELEDEMKVLGFEPHNYRKYHDGRIEIDCDNEFRYI